MTTAGKIILLSAVAGTGVYITCSILKQKKLVEDTQFTAGSVKVKFNAVNSVTVTGTLRILNKSDAVFKISSQNIGIYINGTYISNIADTGKIEIAAHATSEIPISVTFNPFIVLGTALSSGIENVSLQLQGRINVWHSIFYVMIPVNETYKLSDLT